MNNIFVYIDLEISWIQEKRSELNNYHLIECPNYASLKAVHEKSIRKLEEKRARFKKLEQCMQQLKKEWTKLDELEEKQSTCVNNIKDYFESVDEFNFEFARRNTPHNILNKQETWENVHVLHTKINRLADKITSTCDNTTSEKVARVLRNFDEKKFSAVKGESITVLDSKNSTWWKVRKNDGSEGLARAEYFKLIEENKNVTFSKKKILNLFSKNSKTNENINSLVLKKREEINKICVDLQSSTEKCAQKDVEFHKLGLLNRNDQFTSETSAKQVHKQIKENLNAENFKQLYKNFLLWINIKKSTYENNKGKQDVLSFHKTTVDFLEEIRKMNKTFLKFEEEAKMIGPDDIQKMVGENRRDLHILQASGMENLKYTESKLISIEKFKCVDKINLRL